MEKLAKLGLWLDIDVQLTAEAHCGQCALE